MVGGVLLLLSAAILILRVETGRQTLEAISPDVQPRDGTLATTLPQRST